MFSLDVETPQQVSEILNADIHIIKFSATWCRPCKILQNTINEHLQDEVFNNTILMHVDIDDEEFAEMFPDYGVNTIPHVVVKNKTETKHIVGNKFEQIVEAINELRGSVDT